MSAAKALHDGPGRVKHPALNGRNSNFMKYLLWFESVQGSLPEASGTDLFPCVLPYPEVLHIVELGGKADALQWWAKSWINSLVAWSNFVVLGCPVPERYMYVPRVTHRCLADARRFSGRLLGEVLEFAAWEFVVGELDCEGKKAALEAAIKKFPCTGASYEHIPFQEGGHTPSVALPVEAERLAVPEKAGIVDPLDWLPDERAEVVKHLADLRLPEAQWDEVPVACHRVAETEERKVAEKLLQTRMAVLVPEAELPRRGDGKLLTGGLFCVGKNSTEDRLIFDRRPENSTMPRLRWADLPSGACFCRLLLRDDEFLRGSGDDLRNFYYTLKLPEDWIPYNSVGRRVDPELVKRYGGNPREPHRLAFRVLGMGDKNGCDIAQAVHEGVLKKFGVLDPQTTLAHNRKVPSSSLWEGAYLDDLLVVLRVKAGSVVPQDGSFEPPPSLHMRPPT